MSEIVYWLLNMSLLASVAGLVIIVLRRIRKLPRRFIYILWSIPFLRFILPFAFTWDFSFFRLLDHFRYATVVFWKPIPSTNINLQLAASNYMGAADFKNNYIYRAPFQFKTDLLGDIFHTAFWIWLFVALVLVLFIVGSYIITLQSVKNNESNLTTPMVYGLFHQQIFIPTNVTNPDRKYILLHEKVHFRRHDNLFRMLALIIICIHWFNPFAWLFLKLLYTDMELSCDETVYSTLSDEDKLSYAHTIINQTKGSSSYMTAFSGAPVSLRIQQLLSYRKMTLLSLIILLSFLAVISVTLLTNAA